MTEYGIIQMAEYIMQNEEVVNLADVFKGLVKQYEPVSNNKI